MPDRSAIRAATVRAAEGRIEEARRQPIRILDAAMRTSILKRLVVSRTDLAGRADERSRDTRVAGSSDTTSDSADSIGPRSPSSRSSSKGLCLTPQRTPLARRSRFLREHRPGRNADGARPVSIEDTFDGCDAQFHDLGEDQFAEVMQRSHGGADRARASALEIAGRGFTANTVSPAFRTYHSVRCGKMVEALRSGRSDNRVPLCPR